MRVHTLGPALGQERFSLFPNFANRPHPGHAPASPAAPWWGWGCQAGTRLAGPPRHTGEGAGGGVPAPSFTLVQAQAVSAPDTGSGQQGRCIHHQGASAALGGSSHRHPPGQGLWEGSAGHRLPVTQSIHHRATQPGWAQAGLRLPGARASAHPLPTAPMGGGTPLITQHGYPQPCETPVGERGPRLPAPRAGKCPKWRRPGGGRGPDPGPLRWQSWRQHRGCGGTTTTSTPALGTCSPGSTSQGDPRPRPPAWCHLRVPKARYHRRQGTARYRPHQGSGPTGCETPIAQHHRGSVPPAVPHRLVPPTR